MPQLSHAVAKVHGIYTFPVKSCGGVRVRRCPVVRTGAVWMGDKHGAFSTTANAQRRPVCVMCSQAIVLPEGQLRLSTSCGDARGPPGHGTIPISFILRLTACLDNTTRAGLLSIGSGPSSAKTRAASRRSVQCRSSPEFTHTSQAPRLNSSPTQLLQRIERACRSPCLTMTTNRYTCHWRSMLQRWTAA